MNGRLAQLDTLLPDPENTTGVWESATAWEHWRAAYDYTTPDDGTLLKRLTRSIIPGATAQSRLRTDYTWLPGLRSLQQISNVVTAATTSIGAGDPLMPVPFTASQHTYTVNTLGQRTAHAQTYNAWLLGGSANGIDKGTGLS